MDMASISHQETELRHSVVGNDDVHAPEQGLELAALMNTATIATALQMRCCSRDCVAPFRGKEDEVLELRQPLFSKSRSGRRVYHALNPSVRQHARAVKEGTNTKEPLYIERDIRKHRLCVTGYQRIMGIGSEDMWHPLLEDAGYEDPAMDEV
jgi:hypothetical protein